MYFAAELSSVWCSHVRIETPHLSPSAPKVYEFNIDLHVISGQGVLLPPLAYFSFAVARKAQRRRDFQDSSVQVHRMSLDVTLP